MTSVTSEFSPVHPMELVTEETVLVTGGAGFIGSHTAETLLRRGNKVVVVDNFNDYYDVSQKEANIAHLHEICAEHGIFGNQLVVVRGDISDLPLLSSIFEAHAPKLVVHLAARAGVRASIDDPHIYVEANIAGTTNLLELSHKTGVKHFVYASSSSVYGGSTAEVFTEKDSVDAPVSPYAATKKSCELLAAVYNHIYSLPTAGLRFFTVYGPRGRPDMAPYKFLMRAFHGIPIDRYGDGSSERDYTYISDIVDGIIRALDRPAGCQVYNLGNGRPIKLGRFIDMVGKVVAPVRGLTINVMPDQPGDVRRTCADISKSKIMLGYSPKVPFEDGLQKTYEWFKHRSLMREAASKLLSESAQLERKEEKHHSKDPSAGIHKQVRRAHSAPASQVRPTFLLRNPFPAP